MVGPADVVLSTRAAGRQARCHATAKNRQGENMERQLTDEEVTVIGFALLLVTGNDAITSQIRDEAAAYLRAKRAQVRSLAYWWGELDLSKSVTVHVETKTHHLRWLRCSDH
jgi:hypothetical protein